MSEINNYIRQRREHITFYTTTQDVRAELLRSIAPGINQADMYPKARQLINDEEYLYILRDMFNLSNVLDDMEFTGRGACAGLAVFVDLQWGGTGVSSTRGIWGQDGLFGMCCKQWSAAAG